MFGVVTGTGVGLHYGSSFIKHIVELPVLPPQFSSEVHFPQLFLLDFFSQNPARGAGVHYDSLYDLQVFVFLVIPPQNSSPVHF